MAAGDYDVIVVGAGNAAFCAAMTAREAGATVLVLERAPEDENGGNSRFTAGAIRFAYNGVDDLKALAAVLIQADRFGASIAQSLRVFSEGLRTKRRQRAEEKAAKMTVKMIPPMVFFIFPAIFVVVAGPAALKIMDFLGVLGGG